MNTKRWTVLLTLFLLLFVNIPTMVLGDYNGWPHDDGLGNDWQDTDNEWSRDGDWTLGSSEKVVMANRSIYLEGNLSIPSGGRLILDNSSLYLIGSFAGEYGIDVGGLFVVKNSSIMSWGSRFGFEVRSGGRLVMENSYLSDCGYAAVDGSRGLTLSGTGSLIRNSSIMNCYTGIHLLGGKNNIIQNNTISHCSQEAMYLSSSANSNNISYNTMEYDQVRGITLLNVRSNDISFNKIQRNPLGIQTAMTSMGNKITNNTFSDPTNVNSQGSNRWNYNYFCDYAGADTNGDLVGDTSLPYSTGFSSGGDPHPRTRISLASSIRTYASPVAAYNAAALTDTMTLSPGVYYGEIIVLKNMDIAGQDPWWTSWLGTSGSNPVVEVQGNVHCNVSSISFENAPTGVQYDAGSNMYSTVSNCIFNWDTNTGVRINTASSKELVNNTFWSPDVGVNLTTASGIDIRNSSFMGSWYGIWMSECDHVTILENDIVWCNVGLYILDSNTIRINNTTFEEQMGNHITIRSNPGPMYSSLIDIENSTFLGSCIDAIYCMVEGLDITRSSFKSYLAGPQGVESIGGRYINISFCSYKGYTLSFFGRSTNDVSFENNTVTGNLLPSPSLAVTGGSFIAVCNNTIGNGSGTAGILIVPPFSGFGVTAYIRIEKNWLENFHGDGIRIEGSPLNTISNVLCRNNTIRNANMAGGSYGVNIARFVASALIENNTISCHPGSNAQDVSGMSWRMNYFGDYDGSSRIPDIPVVLGDGASYQIGDTAGLSGGVTYPIPGGMTSVVDNYPRTKVTISGTGWTTATIGEAIRLSAPGGDSIDVDNGLYFENPVMSSHLHIKGADRTKCIVNGSSALYSVPTISMSFVNGASIHRLTVESQQEALNISGSSGIVVENCTFRDATNGIVAEFSSNIFLNDTEMVNNDLYAADICRGSYSVFLERDTVHHGPIGIHVIDCQGLVSMKKLAGYGNDWAAVYIDRNNYPVVVSDSALNNNSVGLSISSSGGTTLVNSVVDDSVQGVLLDSSRDCDINETVFHRNNMSIIFMASEYCGLYYNDIHSSEIGILMLQTNSTDVFHNTIDDCQMGLALSNSSFSSLLWNTLTNIRGTGVIFSSISIANALAWTSIDAEIGIMLMNQTYNFFYFDTVNANIAVYSDTFAMDGFVNCSLTGDSISVYMTDRSDLYLLNTTFDDTKLYFEKDVDYGLTSSALQGGIAYDVHNKNVLGSLEGSYFKFASGDFNGDGHMDMILANSSVGGNDVQVYLGHYDELDPDRADADLFESSTVDYGKGLATGDINGDGIDDLVVGDPSYNSNEGRVWVYYGGPTLNTTADLVISPPTTSTNWSFGYDIACGDHNGDGYDDIMISAPFFVNHSSLEGKVFMYYGSPNPNNVVDLQLNSPSAGSYFGSSVAFGDLNRDGYDDAMVGAPRYDWEFEGYDEVDVGQVLLYYGSTTPSTRYEQNLTGSDPDEHFGQVVSAADINGDGFDDVVASAPGASVDTGAVRFFLGQPGTMDARKDGEVMGIAPGGQFGYSVSVGRLDTDGCDDLLVGAPFADHPTRGVDVGYMMAIHGTTSMRPTRDGMIETPLETWKVWGAFPSERVGEAVGMAHIQPNSTLTVANYLHIGVTNDSVPVSGAAANVSDNGRSLFNGLTDASGTLEWLEVVDRIYDGSVNVVENRTRVNVSYGLFDESRDVNMSTSHWELFGDDGPTASMIPDQSIPEDSMNSAFLNISMYFTANPFLSDQTLTFTVANNSRPTIANITVNGDILGVDLLTGSANDNWTGQIEVRLECKDAMGLSTLSNLFTINVTNLNDPPLITGTDRTLVLEDHFFFTQYGVVDGDVGDTHTWSIHTTASFLTLDATGNLTGTPHNADVGSYTVNVTVSDLAGATAFRVFTLHVQNTNDAPTLDELPDQIMSEGSAPWDLDLSKYAHDADVGDTHTFYITGEDTELFTVSGENSSSTLTFTLANDDVNGEVNVTVWVRDNAGATASRPLLVRVTPVNDAPSIIPVVEDLSTPEDTETVLNLSGHGSDPENDPLTWYLTGENTALFSVTGENISKRLSIVPVANMYGNTRVTLHVSDNAGSGASQKLWINITPVNDAPWFPEQETNYSVTAGEPLILHLDGKVSDIDTPYSLLVISTNSVFASVNGKNITFSYPADHSGVEVVTLTVSDGELNDTLEIIVTIEALPAVVTPDMAINITGVVYYDTGPYDGVLVSGATILLKNASGTVATTLTDTKGSFSFTEIFKGVSYSLVITPSSEDAASVENNISGYLPYNFATDVLNNDADFSISLPYFNATSGMTSGGGSSGGEVEPGTHNTNNNGTLNQTDGNVSDDNPGFLEKNGLWLIIIVALVILIAILIVVLLLRGKKKEEEEVSGEEADEKAVDGEDEDAGAPELDDGPPELEDEPEEGEDEGADASKYAFKDRGRDKPEYIEPEFVGDDVEIPEVDEDMDVGTLPTDDDLPELDDMDELPK